VADRPISGGIHDPGHLVQFGLRAFAAARPLQSAGLDAALGIAGVDATKDIADQLRGNGSFQIDGNRVLFRAGLKDPRAMFATLGRLVPLLRKRVNVVPAAPRIYEVRRAGVARYAFGVYGGQFVAGRGSAGDLRDFAAAGSATVPGARGTLTFRVTAGTLRGLVEHRAGIPGVMGHFLLSDIGDITGWARATGSTLAAHGHLAIGG
jgi:hypothetical protein